MRQSDKNKLEKLLKNVDAGFIPKELILSANIKTREGEELILTPDQYEEIVLKEAENFKLDPYLEPNILEMRMMLDLEKINKILKAYSKQVLDIFK